MLRGYGNVCDVAGNSKRSTRQRGISPAGANLGPGARMTRSPRLHLPGGIYHVMSRGNRKAPIFEDDEDRRCFLRVVEAMTTRYDVSCYAYCLMSNHYHMVIKTSGDNLSRAMQYVNGLFPQLSNQRHTRTGHVFEGRFHSRIVEDARYLREVIRYVVLNPVRAAIVARADAWPWSSHPGTAGLDRASLFLDTSWLDLAFGEASWREQQAAYCYFISLAQPVLSHPEGSANNMAAGGPSIEHPLRPTAPMVPERMPRSHQALSRPSLDELCTGRWTSTSPEERARLVHEVHDHYRYTIGAIAKHLRVHPRTVSTYLRRARISQTARSRG